MDYNYTEDDLIGRYLLDCHTSGTKPDPNIVGYYPLRVWEEYADSADEFLVMLGNGDIP